MMPKSSLPLAFKVHSDDFPSAQQKDAHPIIDLRSVLRRLDGVSAISSECLRMVAGMVVVGGTNREAFA